MLVNQLWKVNIKYKGGTYESFHLQKRYENELEVEFLFQIHFQRQRTNESIDAENELESDPDAPKRWTKQVFKYSTTCINLIIICISFSSRCFQKIKMIEKCKDLE